MTNQPTHQAKWKFFETVFLILSATLLGLWFTGTLAAWVSSGSEAASNGMTTMLSWAFWLLTWGLTVSAILAVFTLIWYTPMWKRMRLRSLTRLDTDIALIRQEVSKGQAELAGLVAKAQESEARSRAIEGKAEALLIEARANADRLKYIVQAVSAGKSAFVMDTTQATPLETAKLIAHPQPHPLLEADTSPSIILPEKVDLLELLPNQRGDLNRLMLGVGIDHGQMAPVTIDLESFVHGLLAGSSGWGKSVLARAIAFQMLTAPQPINIAMVDIEGVTFSTFAGNSRLMFPVCDNEAGAVKILDYFLDELRRRKERFAQYPLVEKLSEYNQVTDEPLPPQVIFVDEITTLLSKSKPFTERLTELKLRGRKYGVYGVASGQDFKANILPTELRNQYSTRIQLKAQDATQSRVILGDPIAKDITLRGRGYALLPGRTMCELQTPYLGKQACLDLTRQPTADADPNEWTFVETTFDLNKWLIANPVETVKRKDRPSRILYLASQGVDHLADLVRGCYSKDGTTQREQIIKILSSQGYQLTEDRRFV